MYFDTFFTASGLPVSPHTEVKAIKAGEAVLAELWPVGGKPAHQRRQSMGREKDKITSFSTGPASTPTHWKQTIFILREPMIVSGGCTCTRGWILANSFYIMLQVPLYMAVSAVVRVITIHENWMLRFITRLWSLREFRPLRIQLYKCIRSGERIVVEIGWALVFLFSHISLFYCNSSHYILLKTMQADFSLPNSRLVMAWTLQLLDSDLP